MKKSSQAGFHILPLVLVLCVLGVVFFAGLKVFEKNNKDTTQSSGSTANGDVVWGFNEKELKWFAKSGTPTQCADPYVFDRSPVDLAKIEVIGMPGAYRGFNYKPHGGMRLKDMNSGKIEIVMPADATLVNLKRYFEGSPAELQYLLTFETDCGIAFRFDHVYTLTPEFAEIAKKTPEPKLNDTLSDPNAPFERKKFKAGEVVATEVGFPATKNFGFDFGTYDYRMPNDISKNKTWAAIHNQFQSLEWYGRCWIEQLPGSDIQKAKELSLKVVNPSKPNIVSDYCSYAPHKTLDFNGGQPTDG